MEKKQERITTRTGIIVIQESTREEASLKNTTHEHIHSLVNKEQPQSIKRSIVDYGSTKYSEMHLKDDIASLAKNKQFSFKDGTPILQSNLNNGTNLSIKLYPLSSSEYYGQTNFKFQNKDVTVEWKYNAQTGALAYTAKES